MSEKENGLDDATVNVADAEVPEQADPARADESDLAALLEDARGKVDEHWNQCLRLQAEIDNLHKRSERDLANAHKFALERFAVELLPVRDSMELGLAAIDTESNDISKLREGVELTLQMLTNVMSKFQILEVNPENEPFNPDFHQAMSLQERADVKPNTVVTVVQKGYLLNDRLIRPAMVIVSRAPTNG